MPTDIVVPELGESITSALVAKWLKAAGESIVADEPIVELETDKVALEVPAPVSGTLLEVLQQEGAEVTPATVLGRIKEGKVDTKANATKSSPTASSTKEKTATAVKESNLKSAPTARASASSKGIPLEQVAGSGLGGAITRADVDKHEASPVPDSLVPAYRIAPPSARKTDERGEEVVAMSRLRQKIAVRLKDSTATSSPTIDLQRGQHVGDHHLAPPPPRGV